MKNITILSLLVLMINGALFAQNVIEGSISNEAGEILAATTITLQNLDNDRLTKVMTTDEEGYFIMENMADGQYQLEVTSIGYERSVIANFEFPRDTDQIVGLTLTATEMIMPTAKNLDQNNPDNKLVALDSHE